jgi:dihydrofolate synthase/folylpolyglutamate synthase
MIDTLAESFPAGRRLLILAASSDKDVPGILRTVAPHFQRFLLTRYTLNQRAAPPQEMAEELKKYTEAPIEIQADPVDAWKSAKREAGPNDLIVVTGSVFLAGELRPHLV